MTTQTATREQRIDTQLEALHLEAAQVAGRAAGHIASIHRLVGDKSTTTYVRRSPVTRWALTDRDAVAIKTSARAYDQAALDRAQTALTDLLAQARQLEEQIERLDAVYAEAPWSRFFVVQGGHIHSSTRCSTCNNGLHATTFGWLPALSGLTEADAVAEHGAILCTVCFPSAPVEWTNKYEVEAAAKASANCPGVRDWDAPSRTGYCAGNWATCTEGHTASVTSTGKLRAHKRPA